MRTRTAENARELRREGAYVMLIGDADALWCCPEPLNPEPWSLCRSQVDLLCNDCQKASRARFHIVGQKCPAEGCGSYNTRRATILRFPQVGDACGKFARSSLVAAAVCVYAISGDIQMCMRPLVITLYIRTTTIYNNTYLYLHGARRTRSQTCCLRCRSCCRRRSRRGWTDAARRAQPVSPPSAGPVPAPAAAAARRRRLCTSGDTAAVRLPSGICLSLPCRVWRRRGRECLRQAVVPAA